MTVGAMAPPARDADLPFELTSFVGRRRERTDIKQLLSDARLVTLTGFGGIGKTRLALRVAAEVRRVLPDGVRLVRLGELSEPALLADTMATQLGLQGQTAATVHDGLVDFLKERDLLVVLDNCEHLIDECALLAGALLRACPMLRILATSREPLGIDGEAVYTLHPLSVPSATDTPDTGVRSYDSVRLFVDRARSVLPDFALDERNLTAIAGICQFLEGIPLAVELAAVRLRALSPEEILEKLVDHWQLLTVGSRGAPDRHRTMEACVEWSYHLCSPEEQDLWARAAVFAGGFETDAAEWLYRGDPTNAEREGVLNLVTALADKSILIREELGGRVRLRMLDTIRMHGLRKLSDSGRLTEMRRRHRTWCSDLTERANADWLSSRQVEWARRLRGEHANLRAALDFCANEPGEADAGLRIATNLHDYIVEQGLLRLGRHWFDRLLSHPGGATITRVAALRSASWVAILQGDLRAGDVLIREGRGVTDALDELAAAYLDQVSGLHAMFSGHLGDGITELERALAVFRRNRAPIWQLQTFNLLILANGLAGQPEQALTYFRESLAITEPAGEIWYRSVSLWSAGLVKLAQGDVVASTELQRESLTLRMGIDSRLGIASSLDALAWAAAGTDARRAAILLGAADARWRVIGTSSTSLPGLAALRALCEQKVRDSLGEAKFTSAFEIGLGLGDTAAIDFAVGGKVTAAQESQPAPASPPTTLTKREQQIATLVARGLTNREIARELIISPRTADTHVENILVKLGFTSRVQIANWVAQNN
jgi:predicted ATPase/DNA-binding CsgD family transcriptional regulator